MADNGFGFESGDHIDVSSRVDGPDVDMGGATRPGFGSISQVRSAFSKTFGAARKAAGLASKAGGTASRHSGLRGGDGETTASDDARRLARKPGRAADRARRRAVRAYSRHRRKVDARARGALGRWNDAKPTGEMPRSVGRRFDRLKQRQFRRRARADRRRWRRMSRHVRRHRTRVGRAVNRSSDRLRGAGRALNRAAGSVRALAARAAGVRAAVVSAPMVGLVLVAVIVLVVVLGAFMGGAGGDDCGDDGTLTVASGTGDDYYYRLSGPHPGGPLNATDYATGYAFGNCTDFAAWRVNRDRGSTHPPFKFRHAQLTPRGGNGMQWGQPGNLPGWTTVKDATRIRPGAIISYQPGVDGADAQYGHVAYLASNDGHTVTEEGYSAYKYYRTPKSLAHLQQEIDSGGIVVKQAGDKISVSSSDASGCDVTGKGASGPATKDVAELQDYARGLLHDEDQYQCLAQIVSKESNWNVTAENPTSGAYGIPQALPGSKMANPPGGADWRTNGKTQLDWMIRYYLGTPGGHRPPYSSPCDAWRFRQVHGWY